MNNIFIYKNSPAVWRRVFHSFDWRKRTGHLYFPSLIKAALYCGHDPQHPRSSSHSNYATVHWKYETSSWIPRASLILLFQSEKIETHWIYKNERNIPSPSYIIWKQNYLFRARVLHYKNKLLTAFFFFSAGVEFLYGASNILPLFSCRNFMGSVAATKFLIN